jgi:hypothetical protein
MKNHRPLHLVSVEVPELTAHEAEALTDLIEQVQDALWDTYGDAILDRAADKYPFLEQHQDDPLDPEHPSS